jgi:hypothetical protein
LYVWAEVAGAAFADEVEESFSKVGLVVTVEMYERFPMAGPLASRLVARADRGVVAVAEAPSTNLRWVLSELGRHGTLRSGGGTPVYRAFLRPPATEGLPESWSWVREIRDGDDLAREVDAVHRAVLGQDRVRE